MIRVLIVDDQALVRAGFRMILDAEPDIEIVAEASDGLEAVDLAGRYTLDVVLMDIRMPNLDGIEATRRLVAQALEAEPERRARRQCAQPDEHEHGHDERHEVARRRVALRVAEDPGQVDVVDADRVVRHHPQLRAGPVEVRREQLAKLCELAMLPNVTLHLLQRTTVIGEFYLPPTAFSLYRFADPQDPETLAIEGGFIDVMSHDANTVNRYKVAFEWLCSAALSASDTLSWLFEATGRLTDTAAPSTAAHGSAAAPAQRRRPTGRLTER